VVLAVANGTARTLIASSDMKTLYCQDSFLGFTLQKKYISGKIKVWVRLWKGRL
jgi:hypothetical protein